MVRRYLAYKDSGAGWVGEVPDHWRVEKFRWVTKLSNQKNGDDVERPMLSLSAYDGIKFKEYEYETQKRTEEQNMVYMVVKPSQLVVNPMWVMKRSIAVSELDGIVSPAYRVYDISDDYLPRYFHYLMRSDIYVDEYNRHIRGLTTYDRSVRKDDFAELLVPIPPLEEQKAIVAFLEEQTAVINQFLANKRQLITLLEEQKQVVINTAVTQGLDPNTPRKPSGIDWLDDIPAHWSATKMRRVCIFVRDGTHNPPPAQPGIHRLLSARNIVNGNFVTRDDDRTMTPEAFADLERSFSIKDGDIVVAIVGGTTGKSTVSQGMKNVTVQRSLALFRPKPKVIDSYYLNYWIQSGFIQEQIQMTMIKYAAQPGIYLADCSDLRVVLPPLDEQIQIVRKIDEKTAEINTAIERTQREIELIEEYRTTLIAHAVTGKIDVRPQQEVV